MLGLHGCESGGCGVHVDVEEVVSDPSGRVTLPLRAGGRTESSWGERDGNGRRPVRGGIRTGLWVGGSFGKRELPKGKEVVRWDRIWSAS